MITRTLSIAGNPNIQIVLYYLSRGNAEKESELTVEDARCFTDDFKQQAIIPKGVVVISDLITDVKEMLRANTEMEVLKLHATKKAQERIDADPLLKMWMENNKRAQAEARRMQQIGGGLLG